MDNQLQAIERKCLCSKFYTLAKYGLSILNCLVMVLGLCMVVIATVSLQDEAVMTSDDDTPPNPSIFMLTLGAIITVVGLLGCLSPLRENTVLLRWFSGCVMLMFLLEVSGGALTFIYLHAVSRSVSKFIMDAIIVYEVNEKQRETVDYVQSVYACCGSDSYADWEKNVYYECNSLSQASCGVPPSCCKVRGSSECGFNTRGYGKLYAAHSIYTQGCVHTVVSRVREYLIVVGSIALVVGCIELLSLIMAGILIKNILVNSRHPTSLRTVHTNSKYYSDEEHQLELEPLRAEDNSQLNSYIERDFELQSKPLFTEKELNSLQVERDFELHPEPLCAEYKVQLQVIPLHNNTNTISEQYSVADIQDGGADYRRMHSVKHSVINENLKQILLQ